MNDTMNTVRQAHRYVVAYQRRILDAVAALHDQIGPDGLGFQPDGWEPLHYGYPAKGVFAPKRWAWDFVPMYAARFYWLHQGRKENAAGTTAFMVDHVVDTAFEPVAAKKRQQEPDPLEDLAPSDRSESVLRARWVHLGAPVPANLWQLSWDALVAQSFQCPLAEIWPMEPTDAPRSRARDGMTAGGHVVSVGDLDQPARFGEAFTTPVVAALRLLHGLP